MRSIAISKLGLIPGQEQQKTRGYLNRKQVKKINQLACNQAMRIDSGQLLFFEGTRRNHRQAFKKLDSYC